MIAPTTQRNYMEIILHFAFCILHLYGGSFDSAQDDRWGKWGFLKGLGVLLAVDTGGESGDGAELADKMVLVVIAQLGGGLTD